MEAGELAAQGSTLAPQEECQGGPEVAAPRVVQGSCRNQPGAVAAQLLLNTWARRGVNRGQEEQTVITGCDRSCLKMCFDKFPYQKLPGCTL